MARSDTEVLIESGEKMSLRSAEVEANRIRTRPAILTTLVLKELFERPLRDDFRGFGMGKERKWTCCGWRFGLGGGFSFSRSHDL